MTLAPIGRRALAGLIDAAALALLAGLAFIVPMVLVGFVLPMWGVLAVMVGWSVVPLAFLQQTFGMRLMGLELARHDGHPVDLANVLFRELLGRGLFPAANLFTVAFGVIARALGLMAFAVPVGLGLVMLVASSVACFLAVCGGLLGLVRPDGRGLADLMTKSFVVVAPARPLPEDAEDRAERLARRRTVVRRIVGFEVLLVVGIVAAPWVLTRRTPGESRAEKTARIKREALAERFDRAPADAALAGELVDALERAGLREEAERVLQRHRRALEARERGREERLRAQLAQSPGDEQTAGALVELLDDQGRLDDAIAVYRQWLGPRPTPSRRAGFGHWLGVRQRENEAVAELTQALAEDPTVLMGHTMLGLVLERLERFDEARTELFFALELDPSDEDARDAMERVLAETGPLAPERQKALAQAVRRWTADAGR